MAIDRSSIELFDDLWIDPHHAERKIWVADDVCKHREREQGRAMSAVSPSAKPKKASHEHAQRRGRTALDVRLMTALRVLQEVAHLKQTSSLEVLELDILSARPHHPTVMVATTVVHVTWQPILRPCKQRERDTRTSSRSLDRSAT